MKHFLLFLLTLMLLSCNRLTLPEAMHIDDRDWMAFGKTQQRVNATREVVKPPLALAWEHDISSGMGYGSPIVIDSFVIVTNLRGELHVISANSGKRIGWMNLGDAIHGSPAINSNVAYIATANSRESLMAYDLSEGAVLWKQEYGDIETTPLFHNNRLYVGNTAGIFFCIDKETGEQEWKFRLPENTRRKGIRSSPTYSDDLILFGAEDGRLYALDARFGSERWSRYTGAPLLSAPAVHDGKVFCGNDSGDFVAVDAMTGKIVWQYAAGSSIYATASFAGDLVLIGTTGGKLIALDQNDGTLKWQTVFKGVINSSAVISGEYAYLGTLRKEFAAVRTGDGSVAWRDTLRGRVKTSPAIAHGKVFVATDDKLVLAFKETGNTN